MINRRMSGLLAAVACVALTAAIPAALAQTGPAPLMPPEMAPTQSVPAPMTPPQTADMPPVAVITNGPQVSPGDNSMNWSPQRNVVESNQYERLLRSNPTFKQARINKECGSITEPSLHQQCVASFE